MKLLPPKIAYFHHQHRITLFCAMVFKSTFVSSAIHQWTPNCMAILTVYYVSSEVITSPKIPFPHHLRCIALFCAMVFESTFVSSAIHQWTPNFMAILTVYYASSEVITSPKIAFPHHLRCIALFYAMVFESTFVSSVIHQWTPNLMAILTVYYASSEVITPPKIAFPHH